MAKKRMAYMVYAMDHRKKYEKQAGKKLSATELASYAKTDWDNEPQEVKEHFKARAKGASKTDFMPQQSTSCQRLDTESPVVSRQAQ